MSTSRNRRRYARPIRAFVAAAVAMATVCTGIASLAGPAAAATIAASSVHGVNWADARDNFVNGPIIPSGLSTSDSYATTYAKATAILKGFKAEGANTVRFGINPDTTSSTWWNSYIGAFDAASDNGMNFILGFWAPPGGPNTVTNTTAFYSMWQTVMNRYANNAHFIADIMNEPSGYNATDWTNFAAGFLTHFSSFPRGQILVAGVGADQSIGPVGSDSRLTGTLLSYHQYSVFGDSHTTESAWESDINGNIAGFQSRVVISEFGDYMNTGADYDGPRNGDNNVSYMYAITDLARSDGMGTVLWPGLRTGDSFSLNTLSGSGTNLSLTVTNQSGLDRVQYGWGGGSAGGNGPATLSTVFRSTSSSKCITISGESPADGTRPFISSCGGNEDFQTVTSNSVGQLNMLGKCLDVVGQGTAAGTAVDLYTCNGGSNQQWKLNSNGTITGVQSGLCLDVIGAATANGTELDIWTCNGGSNQHWTRS